MNCTGQLDLISFDKKEQKRARQLFFIKAASCQTGRYTLGTGWKLDVYNTFRRRQERFLSVLCTFTLGPVRSRK